MQYRTQTEVADMLRRLADGGASLDPLRVGDAAELERIAAWVEERSELQADLRVRMERAAIAAYSLGARHALERYQQIDCNNELLGLLEDLRARRRQQTAERSRLEEALGRERVNLATGEITTDTHVTALYDDEGRLVSRTERPVVGKDGGSREQP